MRLIAYSTLKSITCVAVAALAGTGLLVHLILPGGAEADPLKLGRESGFALTRGPFEVTIASSGLIQAFEVVDVGAQVSGQLANLWVKLGDRVQPGQLLAEIDDSRIKARLVQGEAAIENFRAHINAKQAQLVPTI